VVILPNSQRLRKCWGSTKDEDFRWVWLDLWRGEHAERDEEGQLKKEVKDLDLERNETRRGWRRGNSSCLRIPAWAGKDGQSNEKRIGHEWGEAIFPNDRLIQRLRKRFRKGHRLLALFLGKRGKYQRECEKRPVKQGEIVLQKWIRVLRGLGNLNEQEGLL